MPKAGITQLEKLIHDGKWEEARVMFSKLLKESKSSKEQGEVYLRMGIAHMQLMTKLNKKFLSDFKEAAATLKEIDSEEANLNDRVKTAKVREQIDKLTKKKK